MKKAGIITYFGENYGACLQAYAVQETIKKLGCSAEIINYLPVYKENKLERILRRSKHILNIERYKNYLNQKKISKKYSEELQGRSHKFQVFIRDYLNITKTKFEEFSDLKNANFDYDFYTTGSDQVWNPSHHKCNPVYFLDFAPEGKKRIAFAPSIARKTIHAEYKDSMRDLLDRMTHISVREDVSVKTVKDLVPHKEVIHVLDPTFMLSTDEWNKILDEPIKDEKYIFCYIFGDLEYIRDFIKLMKIQTGYKIISMPYNIKEMENKATENIFDAGPKEFIDLIKNAELIITDSFHATAFSINFSKDFYTFIRQKESDPNNMNSRFNSILKVVGLEDRLVLPSTDLSTLKISHINYELPQKKLNIEREKTRDYLLRSIND